MATADSTFSVLYIGVYVGEAISGQIATAFRATGTPWNTALKAIGIVGCVLAVVMILCLREPVRQTSLIQEGVAAVHSEAVREPVISQRPVRDLRRTVDYVVRMRSFWALTLAAGLRQLAGNVFGFYMPGYLTALYPSQEQLLSRYGIIVGVVGSVSVVSGGLLTSYLWRRTVMTPLYLTAIGGMISSIFVILMVFSRSLANQDESRGVTILYGVMSAAYLTAETWLGSFNSLLVLLLPPRCKTFGLALYMAVLVLTYSSGPQIMALALRGVNADSREYVDQVRLALAIIIPLGYWLSGIGFLLSVGLVRRDLRGDLVPKGRMPGRRKTAFIVSMAVLASAVIIFIVTSFVYR